MLLLLLLLRLLLLILLLLLLQPKRRHRSSRLLLPGLLLLLLLLLLDRRRGRCARSRYLCNVVKICLAFRAIGEGDCVVGRMVIDVDLLDRGPYFFALRIGVNHGFPRKEGWEGGREGGRERGGRGA